MLDPQTRPNRRADLEISVMSDGYVVYDPVKDRVHYLNPSSALIFELCDGVNALGDIADAVRAGFDLEAPPHDLVQACVANLSEENLLTS